MKTYIYLIPVLWVIPPRLIKILGLDPDHNYEDACLVREQEKLYVQTAGDSVDMLTAYHTNITEEKAEVDRNIFTTSYADILSPNTPRVAAQFQLLFSRLTAFAGKPIAEYFAARATRTPFDITSDTVNGGACDEPPGTNDGWVEN